MRLLASPGKWFGLIGSALLLFSLTIKWYFLLDDNTNSLPNVLTICFIAISILIVATAAALVVGLHYYVEKKYSNTMTTDEAEPKNLKNLKEEYRNQSKRQKKASWLKWSKKKKSFRIDTVMVDSDSHMASNSSAKQSSTTIYNTNATESNFASNDAASTSTASFSSTKKLVRSNSKFGQPSLPIIDETKQQTANEERQSKPANGQPSTSTAPTCYQIESSHDDVLFDSAKIHQESNWPNKTRHMHKSSTGSAKNYILEAFLKQDLTEGSISSQMLSKSGQQVRDPALSLGNPLSPIGSTNKAINSQVITQLSNQSSSQTNPNGSDNDAFQE